MVSLEKQRLKFEDKDSFNEEILTKTSASGTNSQKSTDRALKDIKVQIYRLNCGLSNKAEPSERRIGGT